MRLRERVDSLGLTNRVQFVGSVDEGELIDHLARCRAVCYTPKAEDYGLFTMEAFVSGKAVITCSDSGGPVELVRTGREGIVVDPEPQLLAEAFREVMEDGKLAERLGRAAQDRAREYTWEKTIRRLLAV